MLGGDGPDGNCSSGSGDAGVSKLGAGAGERPLRFGNDGSFDFEIGGELNAGG